GCRPIVRAIESDGSYGVSAKSSLSSLAQPLACTLIHLLVAARRQLLEALGDRVQTFYRSRTVPRYRPGWSRRCLSRWLASWRGTVNLSGRVSGMQTPGSRHCGLLPTHTADFIPDLERLGPGGSVFHRSDVITAEVKEVIDLIMG